jgi:hypothetical protein
MSVIHADYTPTRLVNFPVFGITVNNIKSAVEAMNRLLVPPSIPVRLGGRAAVVYQVT